MLAPLAPRPCALLRLALLSLALSLVLPSGAALAATNPARSAAYMEEAIAHLNRGDPKAAVIELKNALQQDPTNADARLLLGEVYVQLGDGASAEKELVAARERGIAEHRILGPLGRALLLQRRYADILDQIQPADRPAALEAEIALLRGDAHVGLQQFDEARASFEQAELLDPANANAGIAIARLDMGQGDLEAAEARVDKALAKAPDALHGLVVKGELRRLQGDSQGALDPLDRAAEVAPDNFLPWITRAAVLLDLNEDEKAAADLEKTRELAPAHPMLLYMDALLVARKQDFAGARAALQRAGPRLDDFAPAIFLRGAVAYAENELEQARQSLRRHLGLSPGHVATRKLLASTLIRLAEAPSAIEVLAPVLEQADADPQIYLLLGNAHLQNRQFTEATAFFEKAAALAPEEPRLLTQLALSQFAAGESQQAIDRLEASLDLEPEATGTRVLIALLQLQSQNFDKALEAIAELRQQLPDSPLPLNLEGAAYLGKNDDDAARERFQAALERDEAYAPARMSLARLALRDGDLDQAKQTFGDVLTHNEDYAPAMMALAELAAREGQAEEAVRWLKEAQQSAPQSPEPQIRLVNTYIALEDTEKALAAGRELEQAHPNNPQALDALGRAQMAAERYRAAAESYGRLAALTPNSANAHFLLGQAQLATADRQRALRSLERAVAIDADNVGAYAALVRLLAELDSGSESLDETRDVAARFAAEHAHATLEDRLIGDVSMQAQRYADALAAYESGWQKQPDSTLAVRIFQARVGLGQRQGATARLDAWVEANPEDYQARLTLADAFLFDARFDEAKGHYERLHEANEINPVVLNNLAWLYDEAGDPRAKAFAEKALELAPGSAPIMDTLGWILVRQGEVERALPLLQEATEKLPGNAEMIYHLAVALHENGETAKARSHLENLVKLKIYGDFPAADDARALLERISPN